MTSRPKLASSPAPGSRTKAVLATAILCLVPFTGWTADCRAPGDLDGDGQLTVLDLALLINHVKSPFSGGTGKLPEVLVGYADLDGDGDVDDADIECLVDGILGMPWNQAPRPVRFWPPDQDYVPEIAQLEAYFNQPLKREEWPPTAISIARLGVPQDCDGDGMPLIHEAVFTNGTLSYDPHCFRLILSFPANLPAGRYRATVEGPIQGANGQLLARSYTWHFSTVGEPDADRDGIPDRIELQLMVGDRSYDPHQADSFGDGINDGDRDYDLDDLPNAAEILAGTHIADPDTDHDGWKDGVEIVDSTDPLDPSCYPDWAIVASPPTAIRRPDTDEELSLAILTVVASPPVVLHRPGADENPHASDQQMIVGTPPVGVHRPGVGEDPHALDQQTIMGTPPIETERPPATRIHSFESDESLELMPDSPSRGRKQPSSL